MNIVHFSTTALAGMPLRLVQGLKKHTQHTVHLIDLKDDYQRGNFYFGYDVAFNMQKEEAIELTNSADIIHFHNYLDLDSKQFAPIDFRALAEKGTRFIRQFHSTPALVAQKIGITVQELLHQDIPSLVIAQYPERYYPNARVVPNFVPQDDDLYQPLKNENHKWDIFYSSTQKCGAFEARWDTKGMPETEKMLANLAKRTGCSIKTASFAPFAEVMKYKRQSRIVLDDLTTGSYHLTGLEGLAMGKPVLSRMDQRTSTLMQYFSGTLEIPHINTCFEDAETILEYLLENQDTSEEIGAHGRSWLQKYWSDKKMVGYYEKVYQDLAKNPSLISRQPELQISTPAEKFMYRTLPDLKQISRARKSGADTTLLCQDIESLEP